NIDSSQAWGLYAMPEFLRADVADEVGCRIGVAVGMTVKARHSSAGSFGTAVFRLVELLLRKWRHQQSKALDLLGIKNATESLIVIVDGDELSLGDISQI